MGLVSGGVRGGVKILEQRRKGGGRDGIWDGKGIFEKKLKR